MPLDDSDSIIYKEGRRIFAPSDIVFALDPTASLYIYGNIIINGTPYDGGGGRTEYLKAIYQYQDSGGTTPKNGGVTFDNPDLTLAIKMFLSTETDDKSEVSNVIAKIPAGCNLYMQDRGNSNRWYKFDITTVFTILDTTARVDVVYKEQGTDPLPDNRPVTLVFSKNV